MRLIVLFCVIAGVLATDEECPENSHYESCGTRCPITCDNYLNPPKICVLMCDSGCHCDKGYVKAKDGSCVKPEQCETPETVSCLNQPETGMCRGSFPMFYYDAKTGICREFIYGGCGGNGNRFGTEEDCLEKCSDVRVWESTLEVCDQPIQTGPCLAFMHRYGYNKETKKCEKFVYGGCKSNGNNFLSMDACKRACSAEDVCGENQEYRECGTACPLTCDNHNDPPKICPAMCVSGCHCQEGYVKTDDGQCVKPENCPSKADEVNSCLEEPDEGMCRAAFPMYYYDAKEGICKEFIYGGCGGNGNKFADEETCLTSCSDVRIKEHSSNICELPLKTGPCRAYFPRYGFNKATGKCEKFIYGGCQGNENSFDTIEECQSACSLSGPSACQQEKKVGSCDQKFIRYYFDMFSGTCEEFEYSGCDGNSNNFDEKIDCESVCLRGG